MWRARLNQRDLFDEKPQVAELRPELRSRLAMLLQALLSEAASVGRQTDSTDRDGAEVCDDQD